MQSWDNSWGEIYKHKEGAKYPSEDMIRFMARNFYHLEDRKGVKVLELGCGSGNNIWYLAREGFDAYGIDGSEIAVSRAKERLSREKLSATISVGDIASLDYPTNYFDAVIDGAAIQCNTSQNIKRIVSEVYRALKEGGRFFGLMISANSTKKGEEIEKNTLANFEVGTFIRREGICHFFDREELQILFNNTGFTDISIDYDRSTQDNMANVLEYWLVEAVKATAGRV